MKWNPNSNKHKAVHGGYKGKPTRSEVKANLNLWEINSSENRIIFAPSGTGKPRLGTQLKLAL